MTLAVADGERVWAFRYSSEGRSRSLYFSTRVDTLRALHPDAAFLRDISDETRLVVSEPLGTLPGALRLPARPSRRRLGPKLTSVHRAGEQADGSV
jgi:glutamine amidotransferase